MIEEYKGGGSPLQCVSTTWCMEIDQLGNTFLYDGDKWSRSPQSAPYGADVLSCVSRSFCLAENTDEDDNGNGYVQRWNGTSWKFVTELDVRLFYEDPALSCGAITLCALTDGDGGVYTFSAKNYQTKHFTPSHFIDSVTCSGPSFCLALGRKALHDGRPGNAWTFDGSTWSAPTTFGTRGAHVSMSCGAPTSCAALDVAGNLDTWNGTEWSSTTVPAQGTLDGRPYGSGTVFCVGPSFCLAIDGAGGAHTYNGSSWSDIADPGTGLSNARGLSCVRPSWCLVDVGGTTVIWDGATWSTPKARNPNRAGIHAIDCPTESFCAAVDGRRPVTFGPHGTHYWPEQDLRDCSDPQRCAFEDPVDVSCASKTFCMIVAGHLWTRFDGSSWTALADLGSADWARVSCPTATFCAAVNIAGQASTWNGTSWSAPAKVMPHAGSGLSCPSDHYCLATDTGHAAVSYTHGQWNHYRTTPVGTKIFRISCVTARFCVGTVNTDSRKGGGVVIRRNGHWSRIQQVGKPALGARRGLVDLDCVTTTFCAGIDFTHSNDVPVSVFNGSVWTNRSTGSEADDHLDISCPTTHKCFALVRSQASIGTR